MYDVIQLTGGKRNDPMKQFELNIGDRPTLFSEDADILYQEAVFINGRGRIDPILQAVRACKDELMARIQDQNSAVDQINGWYRTPRGEPRGDRPKRNDFDPESYWKHQVWKDLEDRLCEVFGFRNAQIIPYIEKFNSKSKTFESNELNAFVYQTNRFPIEALITDEGLYDKSRSLTIDMRISLGLMMKLSPEEIVGIMLHEIGHGIDPALVDIKFLETNVLSKYITDRKGIINAAEKRATKRGFYYILIFLLIPYIPSFIAWLGDRFKRLIMGKKKYEEWKAQKLYNQLMDNIQTVLNSDQRQFNRQSYTEAFADNFARMYGYGAEFAKALQKLDAAYDKEINSHIKMEDDRRRYIAGMIIDSLNDAHKTSIHRIKALIREYDDDINDPNVPDVVKQHLRDDKEELVQVLDKYLNHRDSFQAAINNMIYEELNRIDERIAEKQSSMSREEAVAEGFEFFDVDTADLVTESKKAYDKLIKAKESISTSERAEIKKKFGETACSFAKDNKGYYCFTHRCRSKSYKSIDDIPQKSVDFVSSTA